MKMDSFSEQNWQKLRFNKLSFVAVALCHMSHSDLNLERDLDFPEMSKGSIDAIATQMFVG
jgi:hypothetical protein